MIQILGLEKYILAYNSSWPGLSYLGNQFPDVVGDPKSTIAQLGDSRSYQRRNLPAPRRAPDPTILSRFLTPSFLNTPHNGDISEETSKAGAGAACIGY